MAIRGVAFDLFHTLTGRESERSDLPWTSDALGIDRARWDELLTAHSRSRLTGEERDPYRILSALAREADPTIPDDRVRDALRVRIQRFRDSLMRVPPENMMIEGNRYPTSAGRLSRAFGMSWRGPIAIVGIAVVTLYARVLFPAVSLRSGSADNKVTDLQLAYRVGPFAAALERWSATSDRAVGIMKRENIWQLDSTFPAIYGLTLAFLYAWSTGRREPSRLDRWLFGLPLAAAGFDYLENMLELYALKGIDTRADVERAITAQSFSEGAIFWQSVSAHVKYALVAVSLAAAVIVLVARVVRLVRVRLPAAEVSD